MIQARGQPVIDQVIEMLESPYQEVRLQGVKILAGFAADNDRVIATLRAVYEKEGEGEEVKSVAFSALLNAQPASTLEMFRADIAKPRRYEISRSEIYAISQFGYSTLEQVTRILTSSRSDEDKMRSLELISAFINDVGTLVPPVAENNQRQIRRRRVYHDRNYRR